MESVLQGLSAPSFLAISLGVAIALLAADYLMGRLRRGVESHVVFLPAGQPIPVSFKNWRLAVEASEESRKESEEPPARPRRFRRVFLGVVIGTFLQLGLLTLLGAAPRFCEFRGWKPPGAVETSAAEGEHLMPPELPPWPERPQEGES